HSTCTGTWPKHELARIHSRAHGSHGRRGLFHSRSLDCERLGDVLRADVHASGIAPSEHCRDYDLAGPTLDGADGPQPDPGGYWVSGRLSLSVARSRCKILRRV